MSATTQANDLPKSAVFMFLIQPKTVIPVRVVMNIFDIVTI